MDMSVSLPSDKVSLLERQPVTCHQDMSYLGKTTYFVNGYAQLCQLCFVIQSDMLNVYHSPAHIHSFFSPFSSNIKSALETVAVEASPFAISSTQCGYYYRWYTQLLGFHFQGSGFPYPVVKPGLVRFYAQGSYFLARTPGCHIILHNMVFWSPGKVVAIHLDTSTFKAYICNEGGTASISFPD